jgi:hypothetical protein
MYYTQNPPEYQPFAKLRLRKFTLGFDWIEFTLDALIKHQAMTFDFTLLYFIGEAIPSIFQIGCQNSFRLNPPNFIGSRIYIPEPNADDCQNVKLHRSSHETAFLRTLCAPGTAEIHAGHHVSV